MAKTWRLAAAAALLGALGACAERELILSGEREAIRPDSAVLEADDLPALTLPPARAQTDWTHVAGNTTHKQDHAALELPLTQAWSVEIGRGATRRARLTSAPIVAGGRAFAMDSAQTVTALSTSGAVQWRTNLTPEGEQADLGLGGGLAFDEGVLYATTGFGEVVALSPQDGSVLWRTGLDATLQAAPAVSGGRVVAVTRADTAFGLDATTGGVVWRVQGVRLGAGFLGGASPAIRGPVTVLPFRSGEVMGVLTSNGRRIWSAAISGGRRGLVRASISDVTGDPVIDNDIVYAGNQAGRLIALDRRSGERLWTQQEGALGPVVPVDNSLFLVTDAGEVMRLLASTGEIVWRQSLPLWERPERRRGGITHYGPVLAGGRVLVAGSDGLIRAYDPTTGAEDAPTPLSGGAASAPIVAGGQLLVLTQAGRLVAFR
ncbi:MAG: PQQ-binding-like beta-propeller repeat protein [Pseudomonadota bacterium]